VFLVLEKSSGKRIGSRKSSGYYTASKSVTVHLISGTEILLQVAYGEMVI
jgi:hypothetical protein